MLRGSLVAFELDAAKLEHRAKAFEQAFTIGESLLPLSGALLAIGDYHRTVGSSRPAFHFGAPRLTGWWRRLLTGDSRQHLAALVASLGTLFDQIPDAASSMTNALEAIRTGWVASHAREAGLDWQYYMVKYAAMRSGASGVFRGRPEGELGYTIWMLDKENMQGRFRDPYLGALTELSDVGDSAVLGYYELTLVVSELELSSAPTGFIVKLPQLDSHRLLFEGVRSERDDVVDVDDGLGSCTRARVGPDRALLRTRRYCPFRVRRTPPA